MKEVQVDSLILYSTGIADRLVCDALIIKFQDRIDFVSALDVAARRLIIQGQAPCKQKGKRR